MTVYLKVAHRVRTFWQKHSRRDRRIGLFFLWMVAAVLIWWVFGVTR